MTISLYTIGFTQTNASDFFESLRSEKITTLIDVRLNNISQLSGFAKKNDLRFFLREICGIDYLHAPELAPTKDILDDFKKHNGAWSIYEQKFMELMHKRSIEKHFSPDYFNQGCLLCSEKKPHHCHRNLIVKYLKLNWNIEIEVKHLV